MGVGKNIDINYEPPTCRVVSTSAPLPQTCDVVSKHLQLHSSSS
jgi:hypothetical protein